MNILYFNISNGECVTGYSIPQYRATIHRGKVVCIESCFAIDNIIKKGYEWFNSQVKLDNTMWEKTHPHLMKSLNALIDVEKYRNFYKVSNFELDNHRFPYILTWSKNKEYDETYFKNKGDNK